MTSREAEQSDPLLIEIRQELMPGRFIRYADMFDFGRHLHQVEEKIAALVENGEAERAVELYEVFLAAAYDKIVKVLDAQAYKLFVTHYESLVDNGLAAIPDPKPTAIFEYENDVRLPALSLKDIYEAKGDTKSFAGLCDRTGISPGDCERLAKMEMSKKHWKQALAWVEKGLELEPTRSWHNEGSHGLGSKKPEILAKLGRKDESLAMAWADFERHPSNHTYERFMEYVPKVAKVEWHLRAMETVAQADIDDFMDICVATAEWKRLASRVLAASDGALEDLSHYTLEPAAEGLAKRDIPAAAKLYRALGFRVLTSKKSTYYDSALSHFRRALDLYRKAGLDIEWQAVVDRIYAEHSRKYSFMPRFERLLAGRTESNPSFAETARARWQQQVGDRPEVGASE